MAKSKIVTQDRGQLQEASEFAAVVSATPKENKLRLIVVNNIVIVIINRFIDSTNVMMDYSN